MTGVAQESATDTAMASRRSRAGLSQTVAVVVLPIIYLSIGVLSLWRMPPLWRLYPDPAYQYLLNGLGVTVGPGPGHTDHPGTSLQWLIGVVNLGFHSITTTGVPLIQDVTSRPEDYLHVSAVLLISLQSVALYFLGSRLRDCMGLGSGLIAQAAIVGTAALYPFRLYPIPESLVLVAGIALLALVAPKLAKPGGLSGTLLWISLGLVMAVGITAKVIFLPMLVIPIFLYSWRTLLRVYGMFLLGVVVIMWTTRDQLQRMWDWYTSVAKTSARYPDEVVTRSLTDGLRDIPSATLHHFPVVLLALALLVVGLVLRSRSTLGSPWAKDSARVLAALLLAVLGTLGMTYKAFRVNDLLLLAPLAGALGGLGWWYVTQAWPHGVSRRLLPVVPAGAAIIATVLGVQGAASAVERSNTVTDTVRMVPYLEERAAAGTTVATGYGVFSQASALYWANEWARYVSLPESLRTYPGWIEYNIWNGLFYTFNPVDGVHLATCPELKAIIDTPGGLILAPGRPFEFDTSGVQFTQISYRPERVFGDQIVYRIQDVTCS